MAQFTRPSSDITTDWTTTPLWSKLDEAIADDGDFITGTGNAKTFEVKLSAITDPGIDTGHVIRIRARATGGQAAEKLNTWGLYQGATPIVTQNASITRGSFNEYSIALSEVEASAITDYSDLRVRGLTSQGASETIDVSWAEFETPDLPPVIVNVTVGLIVLGGLQATITNEAPAITINAAVGLLAIGGPQATITNEAPGLTVNAAVGILTLGGPSASVTPGEVTIVAASGALTLGGPSVSIVPGAVSIAVAVGSLVLGGPTALVLPGAVSVPVAVGVLTISGPAATIGITIPVNANVGTLTLSGPSASVVPGAVSVNVAVGTLALSGATALIVGATAVVIDIETSNNEVSVLEQLLLHGYLSHIEMLTEVIAAESIPTSLEVTEAT